jgi:hypothetical protein
VKSGRLKPLHRSHWTVLRNAEDINLHTQRTAQSAWKYTSLFCSRVPHGSNYEHPLLERNAIYVCFDRNRCLYLRGKIVIHLFYTKDGSRMLHLSLLPALLHGTSTSIPSATLRTSESLPHFSGVEFLSSLIMNILSSNVTPYTCFDRNRCLYLRGKMLIYLFYTENGKRRFLLALLFTVL